MPVSTEVPSSVKMTKERRFLWLGLEFRGHRQHATEYESGLSKPFIEWETVPYRIRLFELESVHITDIQEALDLEADRDDIQCYFGLFHPELQEEVKEIALVLQVVNREGHQMYIDLKQFDVP